MHPKLKGSWRVLDPTPRILRRNDPNWRFGPVALLACSATLALVGCGSSSSTGSSPPGGSGKNFPVVAAENFWGSIAKQEAGSRAQVTSIIVNPSADPHAYEPSTADARLVAGARFVVFTGVGYDPWIPKLLNANPVKNRLVLEAGNLVGKKEGDNPHLWYNPSYVARIAAQITASYQRIDPRDSAYFAHQHEHFMNSALRPYQQEISLIGRKYHGVPVAATESIFQYLAQALRLNLVTPYGFMKALSEGTEPTAQERATFDQQVTAKKIKVFVYNSQNSTPDVQGLLSKARAEHIPIVAITETLQPATASFQQWQTAQLRALQRALTKATGH